MKRSATRPKSDTWKMGASASLLMATITCNSNDDDDDDNHNDDDSDLAVLHGRQVLYGPGDAHGHVQLGGDDLTSLTDLQNIDN